MMHAWKMAVVAMVVVVLGAAGTASAAGLAPLPKDDAKATSTFDAAKPAKGVDDVKPPKDEPTPTKASDEPKPVKPPDDVRTGLSPDDLKALYKETPVLIQFQVESFLANREAESSLRWDVKGPVLEVLKGKLLPGRITLAVDSPAAAFDLSRAELEGKQFVAPIKLLGNLADRRFQLVGTRAFIADGPEAAELRRLALADVVGGDVPSTLTLTLTPMAKTFAVDGPKIFEVRMTNKGTQTATYLQSPMAEVDGKLYLMGAGSLHVRDITGRLLDSKGNVVIGEAAPGLPRPVQIPAGLDHVENLDLAKYFNLPAGRYDPILVLAAPDGGRIVSNGLRFQVGAVAAPTDTTAKAATPKPADTGAEKGAGAEDFATLPGVLVKPKPAVNIPDPTKYAPGKPDKGLVAFLRPSKAKFALGEPVEVELRLIKLANQGPPNLAIDTRLERTLTFNVSEVAGSPAPLFVMRQNLWPPEPGITPPERAYLHDGSFWGRVMDLNTLYGKTREELIALNRDTSALGKDGSYEQTGATVYGFPAPGIYTITATYSVVRPRSADGKAPAELPKDWWIGDLQTNPITIQIGDPGK